MNFFGTDGIRGTYGKTITDDMAFLLGKALALSGEQPIVVISRDTRVSGERLFNALVQGVYSGGGNAINLGILPTNAAGHFVRKLGGDFGVMISASHNPPADNGLKVFDKYGVKLCLSKQLEISKAMESLPVAKSSNVFEPIFFDIENIYCDDIREKINVDLKGLRIALDCCYGASFRVARLLFGKCNASVTTFCDSPKGKQINVGCGATHTDFLRQQLLNKHFHLGFAFDGDCDRLAVFEGTTLLDSNAVLFAIAKFFKQTGRLTKDAIVGTTLSNSGLSDALESLGVRLLRSQVGDASVAQMMGENGLNVGGEESGHFIVTDFATSSDALITALLMCKIFIEKGSLIAYTSEYRAKQSKHINIPLEKADSELSEKLLTDLANRVSNLVENCRVVLRKSGTEPKIRAYLEGDNIDEAEKLVVATLAKGG